MGIRQLKKGYQFSPYSLKSKEGERINTGDKAKEAAKFFATEIWGATDQQKAINELKAKFPTEEEARMHWRPWT